MKRKIALGTNTAIVVLLVLGIVCALYYIAERHPLRKDFTQNKIQSLSGTTLKVLKGLDKKVEMIAFVESGSPAENMIGDLLKEYQRRTGNISYRMIDPSKEPSEARRYEVTELGVLVMSGERKKKIPLQDLFGYSSENPEEQQQTPPDFIGEQAFTNAIIAVSAGEQKTLCFTEGHGERNINGQGDSDYASVRMILEGENYKTKTLNIATEKTVPSDCTVVIMAGPSNFIAKIEFDALKTYLDRGGRAMFLLDPMKNSGAEILLADWGVRVGDDIAVDRGSYFGQDPLTPVPEFTYHDITKELAQSKLTVSLPGARSVTESDKKPDGVSVTPLLMTSSDSWAETDLKTATPKYDEGKDMKGPFSLAVAVTGPVNATTSGKSGPETRIVVVGDSDFASNAMMSGVVKLMAGGAGNSDLFVNMVNWLAGEEKLISISPKPTDMKPLNITGPQRLWLFTIYVFVVPVLIILFGCYIWYRRRSL